VSARTILGVDALVAERTWLLATLDTLSDEEFETGPTLCAGWAPRDVLAHLVGIDHPAVYVRSAGRVNAGNAAVVAATRPQSRDQLMTRARTWAAEPTPSSRVIARFLLGDTCVHHQDILRGLGRTRPIAPEVGAAILREGAILSTGTRRNLLRYRVVPTTRGGRPLGRGQVVRGTSEALGLWLAGRRGLDSELDFEGRAAS
jgi:uncharacterized protein (TIGR03083 family)